VRRARRVGVAVFTFALVCVLAFLVVECAPGDPASAQLGTHGSVAAREALRQSLGLHGGFGARLVQWLLDLVRLDLGTSFSDGRSVLRKIAERAPMTLAVALLAMLFAWGLALPPAVWRARRGRIDAVGLVLSILYAVPVPALAVAVLAAGAPFGPSFGSAAAAAACLLPLLLPRVYAHVARALDDALADDALRTLRAAGAGPGRIVRAALRVQLLRLLTLVSVQLPALLSGAVLVEAVFGVPGLGLLAVDALATRDYPVQLGLVVVGAAITLLSTLVVDLVAPSIDPRLADGGER
jgi:peptide/nickel transport system permease protein